MGKKEDKEELMRDMVTMLRHSRPNAKGEMITECNELEEFDTFAYIEGKLMMGSTESTALKLIKTMRYEDVFDIYLWLETNHRILTSRDSFVELDIEKMNWVVEPGEIKGGEDETIGMIGVARVEKTEDKELCSVVFISPDGTFANLTMFGSDSLDERRLGYQDLDTIANYLLKNSHDLCLKE